MRGKLWGGGRGPSQHTHTSMSWRNNTPAASRRERRGAALGNRTKQERRWDRLETLEGPRVPKQGWPQGCAGQWFRALAGSPLPPWRFKESSGPSFQENTQRAFRPPQSWAKHPKGPTERCQLGYRVLTGSSLLPGSRGHGKFASGGGNLPGSPVINFALQCKGPGFNPWWGLGSHTKWHG